LAQRKNLTDYIYFKGTKSYLNPTIHIDEIEKDLIVVDSNSQNNPTEDSDTEYEEHSQKQSLSPTQSQTPTQSQKSITNTTTIGTKRLRIIDEEDDEESKLTVNDIFKRKLRIPL